MMEPVADLIRSTAEEIILPRWRLLTPEEIQEKGPGDLVTIADQEAEERITKGLKGLVPNVPVIGEEACAANPELLATLHKLDEFWVVDPIDGTQNFVYGDTRFAVMVARVRDGRTIQSWIYLPSENKLAMAEEGSGTWLNGKRVVIPPPPADLSALVPAAHLKRLPEPLRSEIKSRLGQFAENRPAFCAGFDYVSLLEGRLHFLVYNRTLPWDHAPGTFLLEQANGKAARFDGSAYEVAAGDRHGLLDAATPASWQQIRSALFG